MAGQVDSRLVLALVSVAGHEPVDIVRFGSLGPGASPGVPLGFADLAESIPAAHLDTAAYARAVWAVLNGTDAQIRPERAISGPVQGQAILRVEFPSPAPLGNLGSEAPLTRRLASGPKAPSTVSTFVIVLAPSPHPGLPPGGFMSPEPTLGEYAIGVEGLALLRLAGADDSGGRAARTAEIGDLIGQLGNQARLRTPIGTEYDLHGGSSNGRRRTDQPLRALPHRGTTDAGADWEYPSRPSAGCGVRYRPFTAPTWPEKATALIGVDQSEAMLDIAHRKPAGDFRQGDLTAIPLPDDSVNAVVCALALVHVPDLSPALREFARVLRPGGRLIISDVHPFLVFLGWHAQFPTKDKQTGFMRLHCHIPSQYISAANSAGLRLRSLEEPPLTELAAATPAADIVPEANRAAFAGLPAVSIWDFGLST